LDDSSLVVQPAVAFATREDDFQSTDVNPVQLPLTQNGAKVLSFPVSAPNEHLKITYNAECIVAAAQLGKSVRAKINIDGTQQLSDYYLCSSVDSAGKTWAGAAKQVVFTAPTAGTHTAAVFGQLISSPGTWRMDDSSLVITRDVLASAVNNDVFSSSSTVEVAVPIKTGGGTVLQFTTAKNNQLVKLTYNGVCGVEGVRGHWLGLRIEVDGVEAAPASGFDFALCSAVAPLSFYSSSGFRQSVIAIPNAGVHKVRVFAQMSDAANWSLQQQSLTVE
jgi:hypothetical protein